jgi:hypothetical protein
MLSSDFSIDSCTHSYLFGIHVRGFNNKIFIFIGSHDFQLSHINGFTWINRRSSLINNNNRIIFISSGRT